MFSVSPRKLSVQMDARMDSGIEMAMTTVCRQLPKKSRIIAAVRSAAMPASTMTPLIDALTKIDWSKSALIFNSGGREVRSCGRRWRIVSTMLSVDATPDL